MLLLAACSILLGHLVCEFARLCVDKRISCVPLDPMMTGQLIGAGMNILICTPGRLLQHMDETAEFDASNVQILVLDEADRILDLV